MLMELTASSSSQLICQRTQKFRKLKPQSEEKGVELSIVRWALLILKSIYSTRLALSYFLWRQLLSVLPSKESLLRMQKLCCCFKRNQCQKLCPDRWHSGCAARVMPLQILLMSYCWSLSWILTKRPLWGLKSYFSLLVLQCLPEQALTDHPQWVAAPHSSRGWLCRRNALWTDGPYCVFAVASRKD